MKSDSASAYSVDELSRQVAHLLQERGLISAQQDNRVSAAPEVRTIRYYTTLGLLDRPQMEGRQARYTERHLLQLLAVKALQTVSLPLSEIQSLLFGLTDPELEHVIENVCESVRVKEKLLKKETFKTTTWREIAIEPGLRLLAADDWQSQLDETLLIERLKAALRVLGAFDGGVRPDGGKEHGRRDDKA